MNELYDFIEIGRDDPHAPDLEPLFQRHSVAMLTASPPESIHMLDAARLAQPDVSFFSIRYKGTPIAMAAFKRIDDTHAEIKSMHVLKELRGKGLARFLLDHLLTEARTAGFTKISLETGVQAPFIPSRMLYVSAGFLPCAPFADYVEDPNSLFMTLDLA